MRIGITGHQRLQAPGEWTWVRAQIDRVLLECAPPLIGITALAIGADQIFAEAICERGGAIEVVVPFPEYELTFDPGAGRAAYLAWLGRAAAIESLARSGSDEACYMRAGERVVDRSDLLIAVWDGAPAASLGGTGDVVGYALTRQCAIVHVNPYTRAVTPSLRR
jgi:hypothetical protein